MWKKKLIDKNLVRRIAENYSCDMLTAFILVSRGITTDDEIPYFLGDDPSLLGNPYMLPGITEAVSRILPAKENREKILIFGDRDVDGITGTVLLADYLRCLGLDVTWRIPAGDEPYGLSMEAVENFAATGGTLVITVDCGIANITEVNRANELGLTVIITDHHIPKEVLPPALAIVNPKLPHADCFFREISGCVVAFKLVSALQDALNARIPDYPRKNREYLQLAALGTIGDIMPLRNENRVIVRYGLSALMDAPRKGLSELLLVMGLSGKPISTEELSWILCPAINSTGHMGCPDKAVELLLEDDPQKRLTLADEIKALNEKRKRLGTKTWPLIEKLASESIVQFDGKLAMAASEDIGRGITGIMANRLIEKFHIPAMVVQLGEKLAIGSIRSPGNYNIRLLLEPLNDLILNYGGHEGALGFSMERSLWEQYVDRLKIEVETIPLTEIPDGETIDIDAKLPHEYITPDIFTLVDRFEPYGQGNRPLTFMSQNMKVLNSAYLGKREPKHLKFFLDTGKYKWLAIFWNGREKAKDDIDAGDRVDLLYTFTRNWYKGTERPEIIIRDIVKSAMI
jgi:single-stranded-DNA-specific exonuclease RecJ